MKLKIKFLKPFSNTVDKGELKLDFIGIIPEKLNSETKARYFWFEPNSIYTKLERELIQQLIQQFGKMSEGDGEGDDLNDLF